MEMKTVQAQEALPPGWGTQCIGDWVGTEAILTFWRNAKNTASIPKTPIQDRSTRKSRAKCYRRHSVMLPLETFQMRKPFPLQTRDAKAMQFWKTGSCLLMATYITLLIIFLKNMLKIAAL